jgi:hypothetical protein
VKGLQFEGGVASRWVEGRVGFLVRARMRQCSSLSTSFVLASLRVLQVDSSCVAGAKGRDRGKPHRAVQAQRDES